VGLTCPLGFRAIGRSFNRIAAPDASESGAPESAFVFLPLFALCATRPDMPSLRPYAEQDWPHFLQLDLETAIDALGESNEDERRKLRERWPQKLAAQGFTPQRFAVPHAQLLVLESERGEYLGHLWITEGHDAIGKRILEVTTMGIRREARGQGLGRQLMQRAEAEARQRGIEDIELSVAGNNRRARDLYRDLGYETVRRTMRKRLRG
jgi:ribosomal protein S18 acetylase RimI-like enzyme